MVEKKGKLEQVKGEVLRADMDMRSPERAFQQRPESF
jgi:hypothetical protein